MDCKKVAVESYKCVQLKGDDKGDNEYDGNDDKGDNEYDGYDDKGDNDYDGYDDY